MEPQSSSEEVPTHNYQFLFDPNADPTESQTSRSDEERHDSSYSVEVVSESGEDEQEQQSEEPTGVQGLVFTESTAQFAGDETPRQAIYSNKWASMAEKMTLRIVLKEVLTQTQTLQEIFDQ